MTPATVQTCIVLAGGQGTRLRGVLGDIPKCLAPVGSRTFLDIQIDCLKKAGIEVFVLSLGHLADQVIQVLRARADHADLWYVVEPELLGTGGAIAYAMDTMQLDEVLVVNGDTYLEGDLSSMLVPLRRDAGELVRMTAVAASDRSRFGGMVLDNMGYVTGFLEKGQSDSGLINAGLYRICRDALPRDCRGAYSLEIDVLNRLVERRQVRASQIQANFVDIGIPADYQRFCARYAL